MVRGVSPYQLMSRRQLTLGELESADFDLLVSAHDATERVKWIFEHTNAPAKHWLIHSEYGFDAPELPTGGDVFDPPSGDEAEFWANYFETSGPSLSSLGKTRICIDATGFMRPHLMFFLAAAKIAGLSCLDVLYADPVGYVAAESTEFSKGPVSAVRQVRGFEGAHFADSGENDLLLIGAGYDHELLARVAESKRAARKVQLSGLPSLRPHMYQESRLRASYAEESMGPQGIRDVAFAPASNPFVTAQILSAIVRERRSFAGGLRNIYLSALGTKPQALGFALFYLTELSEDAASIIFPFSESYIRKAHMAYPVYGITELSWMDS